MKKKFAALLGVAALVGLMFFAPPAEWASAAVPGDPGPVCGEIGAPACNLDVIQAWCALHYFTPQQIALCVFINTVGGELPPPQ